MFRFEDHMPEYWENESRDFQLLTRIDDLLFMGQRADIATIQNLNSSKKCKNTFLPLLAKKVGFFTKEQIEDNVLRHIIGAFRLAVKHKGTELGIMYAVTAILKAENSIGTPRIKRADDDPYTIEILTPVNIINKVALKEFLKYVVPTGFTVNIYSYVSDLKPKTAEFNAIDTLAWGRYFTKNISEIRSDNLGEVSRNIYSSEYLRGNYFGAVGSGIVAEGDLGADPPNKLPEASTGPITSNSSKKDGVTIGD